MVPVASLSEEEKEWQKQFERRFCGAKGSVEHSTTFLDPRLLELAEEVLRKNPEFSYTVYGGYAGAERNALQVFPARHSGSLPPVSAVRVNWSAREKPPGHRDLLGAVMALGLRRDHVGDIVAPEDGGAVVFVEGTKAEYVAGNLFRVGSLQVRCCAADPSSLEISADEGKEIRGTVAAPRLDAVCSLGFGIPRSKVVLLVKAGLARVNWRSVNSPSLQLKEGDVLSLKGRGRLLISELEGKTRKGRTRLKLKKYS